MAFLTTGIFYLINVSHSTNADENLFSLIACHPFFIYSQMLCDPINIWTEITALSAPSNETLW